jgi:hypothetical protein
MSRVKVLLLPVFILLFAACSNKSSAVAYNDTIVEEQNKIIEHILAMSNAVYDPTTAEMHRQKIVEQCDISIAVVSAMDAFEGNTELRDAALALFKFYREIALQEFKQMLQILAQEEITEEDLQKLTDLDERISIRETPLDEAFHNAQSAFSNKYNLMLQRNQFQDAIDGL